ncbi:3-deoxy-manno-octulosonate cytidylyltransferase [Hyphobacterium sp.]|uniref:3-deoxy-manno-octulosonate cytidylyltransferase n=1 Tax=Hyphobacterium sp. TaxID=2004662 RepID=UPI0037482A61
MSVLAVIPARYASTRFPGKPLTDIAGRKMIERVWRHTSAAEGVDQVVVATDDARIADAVAAFGGQAVMTPETCRNGTERALAALDELNSTAEIIINVQGDAVLTPPWVIGAVPVVMRADASIEMATPAVKMPPDTEAKFRAAKAAGEVGGTTVVFDGNMKALYFSKTVIPFQRNPDAGTPTWQHIGLYGYRAETLRRLVALDPSPLEQAESLEQLRALENGIPIRIVEVDYRGRSAWSVDAPSDVAEVVAIIAREGELVS